MTQVGIAKRFKADLAGLPGPIVGKAALWLMDYMVDPDDARFEAHRVKRSLMPNLWTAKLDDTYRVIYRPCRGSALEAPSRLEAGHLAVAVA